ncbi:MAG TPA: glycosyltransferase [Gaiellaceae bacterium]|nr:glycosyltransferase [Gaiellaceae bacterium]
MRLVFITQRVDEDDPALGATVPKLRALAERVDELVVLALCAVPTDLPANVRVETFGAGASPLAGARLVARLAPELRSRPAAVIAHMSPVYAIAAAPLARPLRVPLLLWFTHWRDSRTLRIAERLATRVVSVDDRSFPFPSRKLVAVGHGIEVGEAPVPRPADGVLRVLALGRTSPAKGLMTIVDAVAGLDGVELEIRGPSLTDEERRHRADLVARGARVEEALPRSRVDEAYAQADVLVSNMRAGALDKVVYEAAAAGLPVLVASHGFAALTDGIEPPLRFVQDDAPSLAEHIRGLVDAGPGGRAAAGDELRRRVAHDHSVDHWADAIVAAL